MPFINHSYLNNVSQTLTNKRMKKLDFGAGKQSPKKEINRHNSRIYWRSNIVEKNH